MQKSEENKSIAFIEPRNGNLHIYSKFELPRLGSILLATIMHNKGYKVKAYYMSEKESIRRNVDADIICISSIATTALMSYRLGDFYRSKGKIVIMGGPHITAVPDDAMPHADYCICGEGEKGLPLLISAIENQSALNEIPGLVWRNSEEKIEKNKIAEHILNLDENPFPNFNLLEMEKDHMGAAGDKPTIPMQISRGCPFNCNFCSVTSMFGHRYRFRSIDNVIAELKQYDP